MIVWGGSDDITGTSYTGGRYNPATDSWLPTAGNENPPPRTKHTGVWTGSEMIVWGGETGDSTGFRYDPATDIWTPTSVGAGVPDPRSDHTAIWTGTEMIVWGGNFYGFYGPLDTGGRYNPMTDGWTPTSTGAGAASARYAHTAVWTGSEMIVWGGFDESGNFYLNTGGRYTPATDSWTATSTGAGLPTGRRGHTAVWSGSEMIVWGGTHHNGPYLNTGARYAPGTNSWAPTSTGTGLPAVRGFHSAVWTGSRMIIWGGYDGVNALDTGGLYDPGTDSWTGTATGAGLPAARLQHTAVWTGSKMIVWGGYDNAFLELGTGGRYDPGTDGWTATSTGANAPAARAGHTALWSGSEMLVWGGGSAVLGGNYCACPASATWYLDADGDGYGDPALSEVSCSGTPPGHVADNTDCDDTNPAIHPGAAEVCNNLDDNCNGNVDEGVVLTWYQDVDGDRYGTTGSTATWCYEPLGFVGNALDCNDTDPVVRPGGVERCDGLRNDCTGAGWPALLDDDADGTENACETCVDSDGDGWGDPSASGNLCAPDNCPATPNPDQADPDADGAGTACDACPLDPQNDADGDGDCGDADNCPLTANPGQADSDTDGFGDACDLCPTVASDRNSDADGDGTGDACDPDADGDGTLDTLDADDDGDGVPDDDGDGTSDRCPDLVTTGCDDNCPLDANATQRDRDGDGTGDACDASDGLVEGGTALPGSPPSRRVDSSPTPPTMAWAAEQGAIGYNVYSGALSGLSGGNYGSCYRNRIRTTYATLDNEPAPGTGIFYLVTAVLVEGEGSLGDRSDGTGRPITSECP
jgi:hypothetical protein